MPFCNWCQLESDSPDSCDWCKRPIVRNVATYSSYGDGVALLREDASDSTDRATVIVGGVVAAAFLVLVVYAAMTFGGARPHRTTDPLNTVAESERTWTGSRPSPPVSAPIASAAAPAAPTRSAEAPVRTSPTSVRSPDNAPVKATGAARTASISATPAGFAARDGEVAPNGVYIESVRLSTTRQDDGDYTVQGTVVVGNVSGHRAFDIEFFLVVGERRVRMKSTATDLGHGISGAFSVKAIGVPPEIAQASDAFIHIFANTDSGKVADSLPLGG